MLKGSRLAVVTRLQPISVHGQMSLDIFWVDPEDPEGEIRHARVGTESMPPNISPGDRVHLHYIMGAVVKVTRE